MNGTREFNPQPLDLKLLTNKQAMISSCIKVGFKDELKNLKLILELLIEKTLEYGENELDFELCEEIKTEIKRNF